MITVSIWRRIMKRSNILIMLVICLAFVFGAGALNIDKAHAASGKSIGKCEVSLSRTSYTVKYNEFEELVVQKPKVTVKDGTKTLKKGTDYKLVFSNKKSKKHGTYYVTVKGIGKYTGSVKKKYVIKKINLAGDDACQTEIHKTYFYKGKKIKPKASDVCVAHVAHIRDMRLMITLEEGKDYTVVEGPVFDNNVEVGKGDVRIKVKGKGNFKGTVELDGTFYIMPPKAEITSLKAGTKSFTVTWKKSHGADGYIIGYSGIKETKKDTYYDDWKEIRIDSPKTVTKTVKGLKKGYTYDVIVYSYFEMDDKDWYKPHESYKQVLVK